MKFVTFFDGEQPSLGVVDSDHVYPLEDLGLEYFDMIELIEQLTEAEKAALKVAIENEESQGLPLDQVELLAPIPLPRDIIAVSQNYATHVKETMEGQGLEYKNPAYCSYFFKRVNQAVAPDGDICLHAAITKELDYEVELGFVIGKECRNATQADALDYVFGYTISNDISARDIQRNLPQYSYAKGLDDTTPLGPWIVTKDEITDPQKLDIICRVNGETRQSGNTDDMIFDIAYVIEDLSKGMTLYPGDVILTGTPSGIGGGYETSPVPPRWRCG